MRVAGVKPGKTFDGSRKKLNPFNPAIKLLSSGKQIRFAERSKRKKSRKRRVPQEDISVGDSADELTTTYNVTSEEPSFPMSGLLLRHITSGKVTDNPRTRCRILGES